MAQERNEPCLEKLMERLSEALGTISPLKIEAPGVYYLSSHGYGEFYLVDHTSPIISDEVKRYGKVIPDFVDFLFYPLSELKSGFMLVAYELEKYDVVHNQPEHDSFSLRNVAIYATEYHPEFFGAYPVPRYTPWGNTIRHRSIENGVYWLETDQCQDVLTICYPLWDASLSKEAVNLGSITEYDQTNDINATLGYLFYKKADACIPIFELLKTHRSWHHTGRIAAPALMNAIWQNHPDYVLNHNIREQTGMNDAISWLLEQFDIKSSPNISLENMITLFPDAGVEYLHF